MFVFVVYIIQNIYIGISLKMKFVQSTFNCKFCLFINTLQAISANILLFGSINCNIYCTIQYISVQSTSLLCTDILVCSNNMLFKFYVLEPINSRQCSLLRCYNDNGHLYLYNYLIHAGLSFQIRGGTGTMYFYPLKMIFGTS